MAIRGLFRQGGIFQQNAQGGGDMESAEIAQKFDGAIAKVQGAPRKAQKKIPPDTIPKLQADKAKSVRETDNAKKEEERAQAEASGDPMVEQIVKGQNPDQLMQGMAANFGAQAPVAGASPFKNVSMIKGGDEGLTRGIGGSMMRGARGSGRALGAPAAGEKDPTKLLGNFREAQGQNQALREEVGELGGQQEQLLGVGGKQQKRVEGLGAAKNMFGSKEKSHQAKQQAFGEAGKGLGNAGKGLNTAAQVMSSVSQMLNSTAAAVAAIPFVGPALSAALKKAATVVDVVGKVLKTAGQACQKSGEKMNQKSAHEGGLKDLNKAQKIQTEGKEKQAKNQVGQTQNRLDQVSDAKRDAKGEMDDNAQQQQGIAEKLNELGMPVAAPKTDRGKGGDDRPQIVTKNQNKSARPGAAKPASSGPTPVGGAMSPAAAPKSGPVAENKAANEPAPEVKATAPAAPGNRTGQQPQSQQNPVGPAKAPLNGIKANDKAGPKAGRARDEEEGSAVAGGAAPNGKRQRFETELKRLSEAVQQGKNGSGQHGLRDKQRQLATMYNQAAAENVSVDEQVEKKASDALQNSPDRPSRKLRTVSGSEDLSQVGDEQSPSAARRPAERDAKNAPLRAAVPANRPAANLPGVAALPQAPQPAQSQPVVAA
jgi:hypothetical protein